MNKLFLVCLVFALAAVAAGQPAAQPLFKDQCEANEYMLNKLKGLKTTGNLSYVMLTLNKGQIIS